MITVSIILTTYNSAKSLPRLLKSILQQKGLHSEFTIEWLVVDDCSTDQTCAILEQFTIPYQQTKQNSGGPNKGRNIGLQQATGNFITIVDHDDEWHPTKLMRLLHCANKAPIVSSGYQLINTSKQTSQAIVNTSTDCILYATNQSFQQILSRSYKGQITYIGSLLFANTIAIPKFEEQHGKADWDWVAKLFHQQKSAEVGEVLYNRYVDGTNLSLNENYRKQELQHSLAFLQEQASEYPKLAKTGTLNAYGSMARYYYSVGKMKQAREYFTKSSGSWKNRLYYLTSYFGHQFVNKFVKVFG